jgi:hypothetical protein
MEAHGWEIECDSKVELWVVHRGSAGDQHCKGSAQRVKQGNRGIKKTGGISVCVSE